MTTTTTTTNSIPNYHREIFINKLDRLLQSLSRTFPECEKTLERSLELRVGRNIEATRENVVQEWHKTMKDFYECVKFRDETTFRDLAQNNKWFKELAIVDKWDDPGFQKSHDIMWRNIETLNHHARMHCVISDDTMNTVCNLAVKMVQSGMQLPQLAEEGQRVANSLSIAEVNRFAREGPGMLVDIFSSLKNFNDGDEEKIAKDSFVQILGERLLASGGLEGIQNQNTSEEEAKEKMEKIKKVTSDVLNMKQLFR